MHGSRGNADRRVFGCPRIKRGAPDPRVIQAGCLRLTKPLANKSTCLFANGVEFSLNGGLWDRVAVFGVLSHNWTYFVVFDRCSEEGNMAGTKILS